MLPLHDPDQHSGGRKRDKFGGKSTTVLRLLVTLRAPGEKASLIQVFELILVKSFVVQNHEVGFQNQ